MEEVFVDEMRWCNLEVEAAPELMALFPSDADRLRSAPIQPHPTLLP
jgi:hypothetical protein